MVTNKYDNNEPLMRWYLWGYDAKFTEIIEILDKIMRIILYGSLACHTQNWSIQ
jgi:alkylation response protein AidB-like acyl-CoA dehydrogenase